MNVRRTVTFLFDLDAIPLDFLVERRQRNMKGICRFRLTPRAPLQHLDDDSLLDRIHDIEQRTLLRK